MLQNLGLGSIRREEVNHATPADRPNPAVEPAPQTRTDKTVLALVAGKKVAVAAAGGEPADPAAAPARKENDKPAAPAIQVQETATLDRVAVEEIAAEPLSRIVYHTDPTGLGADRFRYLRLRLRERARIAPMKSLLVTSPEPLDGKSTVALNLATALAERGQNRVLLLEADLYHPVLAGRLALRPGPGLSDCLASGLDPIRALRLASPIGLYLLPGGEPTSNPGDFLHGDSFGKVVDALTPHFRWIVIDAPPVAPLADALALARHADGSLLVVRAGKTPGAAIDATVEALGRDHVVGVVLNGVDNLERRYSKYTNYYRKPRPWAPSGGKTNP